MTGVEYYDEKKERQVQEASVVVLAAWAAQNPRLLLNSATDKHPNGLANTNGLVGKYMMTHFSSGTLAIFDEDVQNHMGTTGAQYMSYERYDKTAHKGAFGSTFIVAGTAIKTSDLGGFANARLDLFGPELAAFMKRAARGFTRIAAFGEEMPNIENRVELASDKDEFGMPLGRIIHSYDDDVRQAVERQLRRRPDDRQGRRRQGGVVRRAAIFRPSTSWAAPSWARARRTRWSTATARPTRSRTSTSPAPASSRPAARRTRPTRSSRCRCAVRSNWRRTGARSRDNLAVETEL